MPGLEPLYLISFYGDTYNREATIDMLDQLVAHAFAAGHPFLIGGDFNLPPEEVQALLGASPRIKHEIHILAPRGATCITASSESTLDYWMAGGGAQQLIHKSMIDLSIPIKTHYAVALSLSTGGKGTPTPWRWVRPNRGSATQVVGPHKQYSHNWEGFEQKLQRAQVIVQGMTNEAIRDLTPCKELDEALDATWEAFQSTVRTEIANRFGADEKAGLPFAIKKHVEGSPAELRHRPNVYKYVGWQRRQVLAIAKWPLTQASWVALRRMGSTDPTMPMTHPMWEWHLLWQRWWAHVAAILTHHKYAGHLAGPLATLGSELGSLEQSTMGYEQALCRNKISEWKDSMFNGAAIPIHQWSKKCKVALIAQAPSAEHGLPSSNPLDILQHTVGVWQKIWQAHDTPPNVHQLLPEPTSSLPPLVIDDLTKAGAKFKRGTAVPDGWHPGQLTRLSKEEDKQHLVDLLNLCESAGRLPPSAKQAMIKMLPKPRGGHRPIALFKALYRLWGKARTPILSKWASSLCTATFTMSPTRRVTDGLFRELVRSLIAQSHESHIIEMHVDVAKFFDHVRRVPLADLARTCGYPVRLLQLSIDVYGAERRIVLDNGFVSSPLWARDGIMAGSPHAVFETMAYLATAARMYAELYPEPKHHLTIFVDDIALQTTDQTIDSCVANFATSTGWMLSHLQDELGLPIETDKTFLLGTSKQLVERVAVAAGSYAGTSVTEVRKLGALYSHQHRRHKPVVKAKLTKNRVEKALARHHRIKALAGPRSFGTVFHTGILPEATFGAELTVMHPASRRALRNAAVKANKLHIMGVPAAVSLLALPVDRDPDWQLDIRVLQGFSREVWNIDHQPHPDQLTLREIGQLFGLPAPMPFTSYESAWKDPIANLHFTLRRMNIRWVHPTVWEYKGAQVERQLLDLRAGTPAMLARLLRPAHRLRQVRQADFPGAPEDWEPLYLFRVLDSQGSKRSLTLNAKKKLLAYMKDQYPSRTTLAKWGFVTDTVCPACGKNDTAYHRIFECSQAWNRDKLTRHLRFWREHEHSCRGILHIEEPELPEVDVTMTYTLGGREVSKDQFQHFRSGDGPVYVDGSALHARTPFATAGWAAIQLVNGKVHRSISAPVHRVFPQTSDIAEHHAFGYVMVHTRDDDPVEVVTDCASVISYFHQARKGTATSHKNVLGGLWCEAKVERVSHVHKIKSHLSQGKACELGVGQWWAGNMEADRLAQRAAERAMISSGEVSSYNTRMAKAVHFLRDIAHSLVHWGGEEVHHYELEKVLTAKADRALKQHSYEWDPEAQLWTCSKCWKHRRRELAHSPDKTGCKEINKADARRLHQSHTLRFAQGPWGARPLMFCAKCGHYTKSRLAALSRPCQGRHTRQGNLTSAYRLYLRTIRRGIHPTIARWRLGAQYTPVFSKGCNEPAVALSRDVRAAQITRLQPVPHKAPPEEVADDLRELEALEREALEAAALEQLQWEHETEVALELGLGFDDP
jgi:hypothetical protein